MATYGLQFYTFDPFGVFSQTTGGTTTYAGPATPTGTAIVNDTGTGIDAFSLDDDDAGEASTADIDLGGVISSGVDVDAEESWTLQDTVTGEIFQIVSFQIESGPSAGYYTVSEIPLVPGRTYETLNFDSLPDASSGDDTFNYDDYDGFQDGIVEGTDGDDVIDTTYTQDTDGDQIDNNDALGSGATELSFNWSSFGDETDLRGGVAQDTGGIEVSVSYSDVDTDEDFSVETNNTLYTEVGEPFSTTSAGYLFADGSANDSTITFDFAATGGSGFEDEVENVQFRINDIDGLNSGGSNFQDILTITAFDADGNPVTVLITPADTGANGVSVTGDTATGSLSNTSEATAQGSILVSIPGPVSQIVVNYDNGGNTQQAVYFTDLHFDAVTPGSNDDTVQAGAGDDIVDAGLGDDTVFGEAGDDTLTGGAGADTLDGGIGDDTLNIGSGDIAIGGDGDDTFVIDTANTDGTGITVTGGEGDETTGDTLDFNGQLVLGSINLTNSDDSAGGLSGTATLLDGTVVTFSEIETLICFVAGTRIATPSGPRTVEEIGVGDLVLTRDNGPQPVRWIGARRLDAGPDMAPIVFAPGSLGNDRALSVSPQHRMVIEGVNAELYFGTNQVLVAAKHLINGTTITQSDPGRIRYYHLLFDRHEVIFAESVPTESYHPGETSLPGIAPLAREELFRVFPELRSNTGGYGPAARLSVKGTQAHLLAPSATECSGVRV